MWAERVESIPMTRGNWPEGGEGHLLPEETGKAGCGVGVSRKLEVQEKTMSHSKSGDGVQKTTWQHREKWQRRY